MKMLAKTMVALALAACSSKPAEPKKAAGSAAAGSAKASGSATPKVDADGLPVLPPAPAPPGAPDSLPAASNAAAAVTGAQIALGELAFFDGRLAADSKTACATCHVPEADFAGTGLQPTAGGTKNLRQAPSLTNSAWQPHQAWDGRFPTVSAMLGAHFEGQLGRPIDAAVAAVASIPLYRAHARRIGGATAEPTAALLSEALSAYVLTRYAGDTTWDRIERGELPEDPELRAGYVLFTGKAQCGTCHVPPLYTDGAFHRLGLIQSKDPGRGKVDPAQLGAFATPSLRGAAARTAFFHDGSVRSLEAAVDWHLAGGRGQGADPSIIDAALAPVTLSPVEREQLLSFVKALSPAASPGRRPLIIP
jgi:cytochrome c peroxidase